MSLYMLLLIYKLYCFYWIKIHIYSDVHTQMCIYVYTHIECMFMNMCAGVLYTHSDQSAHPKWSTPTTSEITGIDTTFVSLVTGFCTVHSLF